MIIEKNVFYTLNEVMLIFKISRSTLLRLTKNKKIKAIKIGGQLRFLGDDLLDMVSEGRQKFKNQTKDI